MGSLKGLGPVTRDGSPRAESGERQVGYGAKSMLLEVGCQPGQL